jgi:phage shock protein PspC (stress-responsive transcriptional regulator)
MPARRLSRSTTDRKIAGVAGGIARHFDLDSTLIRVLWVLAVVFGGFGVLLYIILWILLPEGDEEASFGAVAIAEERFARGEITADDLALIKTDLAQ